MKTQIKSCPVGTDAFDRLPKDYLSLCQRYVPRPLHDAADYAAARQAIEPLVGDVKSLNIFGSRDLALQAALNFIGLEIRKKD